MLFIVQQYHLSCWWTRNQEIANNTSHKSTTRPSRRSPSSQTSNKFWIENMNLPSDWFSASCWPFVPEWRSYTENYKKLYWEGIIRCKTAANFKSLSTSSARLTQVLYPGAVDAWLMESLINKRIGDKDNLNTFSKDNDKNDPEDRRIEGGGA